MIKSGKFTRHNILIGIGIHIHPKSLPNGGVNIPIANKELTRYEPKIVSAIGMNIKNHGNMALPKMKSLLLVALLLCGCAETRLYDHGQLVAVMQGDMSNVTVRSGDFYFHADTLSHSAATTAAYGGVTQVVAGTGAAVAAGLIAVQ